MQETTSHVKTETTRLFNEFINSEKAGGAVLLMVTVISLVIANSGIGTYYLDLWNYNLGGHTLVQWINDGLMTIPLFALANTSIILEGGWYNNFGSSLSLGILAGLVIGKPIGILLFSMTAVRLRFASLPSELSWNNIAGAGMLGGIGFTMSIFIALIGFDSIDLVNISRLSILAASIISAVTGYFWLRMSLKPVG